MPYEATIRHICATWEQGCRYPHPDDYPRVEVKLCGEGTVVRPNGRFKLQLVVKAEFLLEIAGEELLLRRFRIRPQRRLYLLVPIEPQPDGQVPGFRLESVDECVMEALRERLAKKYCGKNIRLLLPLLTLQHYLRLPVAETL